MGFRVLIIPVFFIFLASCNQELTCDGVKNNHQKIISNLKTRIDSINFVNQLSRIIEKKIPCNNALQLRGLFNMAFEKYREAKIDFLKAYINDSLSVFTTYYLGMLYNFEGENTNALYFLQKAKKLKEAPGYIVEYNPDFADNLHISYIDINHFLGVVNFELKRNDIAKSYFLYTMRKGNGGYDTYGYLAAIYASQGKLDSACFYYEKSLPGGRQSLFEPSLAEKCR